MKKVLLAVIAGCFVVSCGFSPLYVQKTSTDDKWYFDGDFDDYVSDQMAQIKIVVTGERLGQLIKTDLLDLLTPRGVPSKPKYYLYVDPVKANEYDQALRRDTTATRKRIDYRVNYYMLENSEKIMQGDTVSYVSYDILENPYSTVMSRKKVEKDAAKMMANDIALRLGAFFNAKANEYEDAEQKDLKEKQQQKAE
jgi:LPS-assembly lipoprotein